MRRYVWLLVALAVAAFLFVMALTTERGHEDIPEIAALAAR